MRIHITIILLFGLMLCACSGSNHPEQPPNREKLISDGEMLYRQYCADCHQIDGEGWSHLYPNFAGNPIVTLHDPEPLINTVLYGQGSMPAFNQRLNPDQLSAILTYIRSSWGNHASPISPRQIH